MGYKTSGLNCQTSSKKSLTFLGINTEVINVLSSMLNFTFKCRETEDGLFGNIDGKTGQWTGLVGAVARKEADFVLGSLAFSKQR